MFGEPSDVELDRQERIYLRAHIRCPVCGLGHSHFSDEALRVERVGFCGQCHCAGVTAKTLKEKLENKTGKRAKIRYADNQQLYIDRFGKEHIIHKFVKVERESI